jgi:hypothetical protein
MKFCSSEKCVLQQWKMCFAAVERIKNEVFAAVERIKNEILQQ